VSHGGAIVVATEHEERPAQARAARSVMSSEHVPYVARAYVTRVPVPAAHPSVTEPVDELMQFAANGSGTGGAGAVSTERHRDDVVDSRRATAPTPLMGMMGGIAVPYTDISHALKASLAGSLDPCCCTVTYLATAAHGSSVPFCGNTMIPV